MPPRLPESLAIQIETKAQQAIPAAEASHVRLSPRVQLFGEIREDVANLINGRMLGMYELSLMMHHRHNLLQYDQVGEKKVPRFPSLSQVAESFDADDLDYVSANYQYPALIMPPPNKAREDLLAVLSNGHEPSICEPTIVDPNYVEPDPEKKFRPFIVEGAGNMKIPDDDWHRASLANRIWRRKSIRQPNEWGMTGDLYTMLAMQSGVRGHMIDKRSATLLDGDPDVGGLHVPVGRCPRNKPLIGLVPSRVKAAINVKFRRVMGGRQIDMKDHL